MIEPPLILKGAGSVLLSCAVLLFGGVDQILLVLVALMILDYATGVTAAWEEKRLDSEVGRKGIITKIGMLVVVSMAALIDSSLLLPDPILRTLTIGFFIANEGLSILENAAILGVPIPTQLKDALEVLRKKT
jgi:toxin secretion/phage lysis holin